MGFNFEKISNAHLLAIFEEEIEGFERKTKDLDKVAKNYEKAKKEILKRMEE